MDKPTYHAAPTTLSIRDARFRVERKRYRTHGIIVATTLWDDKKFTRTDLTELYHHRWRVELSTRDIKQPLAMDFLRGKTPEMGYREIGCHPGAYNLVRRVIAPARVRKRSPRQNSVTAARGRLNAFRSTLSSGAGASWDVKVVALLHAVGGHRVGQRPGRCEPREVKRRPKVYKRMTKPRAIR